LRGIGGRFRLSRAGQGDGGFCPQCPPAWEIEAQVDIFPPLLLRENYIRGELSELGERSEKVDILPGLKSGDSYGLHAYAWMPSVGS